MASALIGALRVTLGLDTAEFENGVKRSKKGLSAAEKSFKTIGSRMQSVGVGISAAIALPFAALVKQSIPAAVEANQALAQVEAAQKSMGGASKLTTQQLQDLASHLEDISLFDDDDILAKSTANLLTFGNISGPIFERTQKAVVDLAARMGTDLQSATIMLGKALNDPAKGLTALRRVGIQFTEDQVKQIKSMSAHNNMIGAQAIMLKELERQFGGAAAAQRKATPQAETQQAWRDFQETIGGIALKVLPPLTTALTGLLQAFNQLSPGLQAVAVGGAAVMAALGPILIGLGALVKLLGPAVGFLARWGASAASAATGAEVAATATLGLRVGLAALVPYLAPLAVAAGAVYLAWKNWDKIAPILQGVWDTVQSTLGPPLQDIFNTITTVATELWQGAFGDEVRAAGAALKEFASFVGQILGQTLLSYVKALAEAVKASFRIIGDVLTVVASLLRGDFAGAWTAAKQIVIDAVTGLWNVFKALAPNITAALQQMVNAVGEWLGNRFASVVDNAKKRINEVKDAFRGLYEAVVGHSYIPDMVMGVQSWMAKLDAYMVQPAKKATQATRDAFEHMGEILDRLFPEDRKARQYAEDVAFVEKWAAKLKLTAEQTAEAISRLNQELMGVDLNANLDVNIDGADQSLEDHQRSIEDVLATLPKVSIETDAVNERFQELGRTINETVVRGIQGMMRGAVSWKDVMLEILFEIGDAIIENVLNNLLKVTGAMGDGSAGGIGGFIAQVAGAIFGQGGMSAHAQGGRMGAGEVGLVGERGPEIWKPDTAGTVIPNNQIGSRPAVVQLSVVPGQMFELQVQRLADEVVLTRAPAIAQASVAGAGRMLTKRRLMMPGG